MLCQTRKELMLIDTHCHLDLMIEQQFETILTAAQIAQIEPIIAHAHRADVTQFIMVGAGLTTSINSVASAAAYSQIFAAIGLHPEGIKDATWREQFATLQKLFDHPSAHKIVAIGECGLDYFHPHNKQLQADAFRAHIELALQHKLAIVVHSRNAADDTLRIIEEYVPEVRGTMHCYSYDLAYAQQAISYNLHLGLGGTITYPKNNDLRTVATTIPLSSIVLETDAPYLPPQHMRGKQNHPAEIKTIAMYLAQLRKLSLEEVANQTTRNAHQLFQLT
jgi:TatD DNase family protein